MFGLNDSLIRSFFIEGDLNAQKYENAKKWNSPCNNRDCRWKH